MSMTSRGRTLEGKTMDQTLNQITRDEPADRPTGSAGARIVALLAVLGGAGS